MERNSDKEAQSKRYPTGILLRGGDEATQALISANAALLGITQGELITQAVKAYCQTTRPRSELSDSDRALLEFMSSLQREKDDGTHSPA